ncbi:MAG: hypothetical protein HYV63_21220 [Candidatus Schekmanbacteria bacterium]|nr:hypothetical protein [Candidatus Schekmanbacteria bacterium]
MQAIDSSTLSTSAYLYADPMVSDPITTEPVTPEPITTEPAPADPIAVEPAPADGYEDLTPVDESAPADPVEAAPPISETAPTETAGGATDATATDSSGSTDSFENIEGDVAATSTSGTSALQDLFAARKSLGDARRNVKDQFLRGVGESMASGSGVVGALRDQLAFARLAMPMRV